MILGAIQISHRTTRLRVTEVEGRESRVLVDRPHRISAELKNCERLGVLLASEVKAAGKAGATRIEVSASPELRGGRLLRLLDRVSRAVGSGQIAVPGRSETLAGAFLAATVPRLEELDGPVAVAFVGESFCGMATGVPGRRPCWTGSRPVGTATLTTRARFSDPPRPNQIEAALSGARRAVQSLVAPEFETAFVATSMSSVLKKLCGERVDSAGARRALDSILGQTADDTAAWFGTEPVSARQLPATIACCLALAESLGSALELADPDPVAGRWWICEADASSTRSAVTG